MTISEAFTYYCVEEITLKNGSEKTVRNYRSACNSLTGSITDLPIILLSPAHLSQWRINRERWGHSPATIGHDLSRVKQVLRLLKKRGMDVLDHDLIDLPRIPKSHPTYLLPREVQEIIDVIDSPRDKAIFACMFDSGARVGELLSINRDELVNNTAPIIGKGGKPGVLRFGPWAMGYLNTYLESRKDSLSPLFVSGHYRRITVSRCEQLLHIYSDKAKIKKNVTPHVLRHSFATDLKMNGADIYDIKEQLRHSRISSTEIYVHIEDEERAKKHARFHTNLSR